MRRIALGLAAAALVVLLLLQAARRERARGDRGTSDAVPTRTADVPATTRNPAAPAAEADVDAAPPDSRAVVHGTVTGRDGPMWGVRVFARPPGDEETVLAQTWTDPKGTYRLELDAPCRVDVVALPEASTMHPGAGQRGLNLGPGESVRLDLDLIPGARVQGRVVDAFGRPLAGVSVLALPYPAAADLESWVHPRRLKTMGPLHARSDDEGLFVLAGVDDRGWRLFLGDRDRTLDGQVQVRPDTEELTLVAVPALDIERRVLDIESGEAVEDLFLEAFQDGDTPALRVPCTGDIVAVRLPNHPQILRMRFAAEGFLPSDWVAHQPRGPDPTLWMWHRRTPNVRLQVWYDDGAPYERPIELEFTGANRVRRQVTLDSTGNGTYLGTLPHGSWQITWTDQFERSRRWSLDLGPGRTLEDSVEVVRGGTLLLRCSPGERCYRLVLLHRPGEERMIRVSFGPGRVEDVPPGSWEIVLLGPEGTEKVAAVDVTAGGTHEVTLPPDPPR